MAMVLLVCQGVAIASASGVSDAAGARDAAATQGVTDDDVAVSEQPVRHTVRFDANAADGGSMEDVVATSGGAGSTWSLTLPACGYTRSGYKFTGWSTTADGVDVKDDAVTEQNEATPAIAVPDKAALNGWNYSLQENGQDTTVALSGAVKGEILTLYAQWAPENESTDAFNPTDPTNDQDAVKDETPTPYAQWAPEGESTGALNPTDPKSDQAGGAFGAGMAPLSARRFVSSPNALGSDAGSHFHATITAGKTSYSAGSTAIVSVKYDIDPNSVHEDDYVTVRIPQDIAKSVRISVSPQHFKQVVDNGDGTYRLVFGPNAEASLTGSFSAFVTTADVATETSDDIEVGGDALRITVIPTGSAGGSSGTYTDAIMKDAMDNGGKVQYGDYDYSEGHGNKAAQTGVYDSTNDQSLKYRLYVNQKMAWMHDVTVVDTLPDGMTFDTSHAIEVVYKDNQEPVDPSQYSVSAEGNKLTFSHPGSFYRSIQINYWVIAKGGENVKYTNRAEINYKDTNNKTYQEHRNYVLQGNNYSAASGEKSVDKTIVSQDPADQWVTYTFKFWNNNGFQEGEIKLDDQLQDSRVKFLYAEGNDKFDVSYDAATHTVHIKNKTAIGGDDTEYVRFVVDFTDVPDGTTVYNSVNGGNTTKTLKMPSVKFHATKTVDGAAPNASLDGKFKFQLLDADGNVLQTKANSGGDVTFDAIEYKEGDIGKTFTYTVQETPSDDADVANAYQLDETKYTVQVVPTKTTDAQGKEVVVATPVITKNGSSVDAMSFDNTSKTGSLSISKVVEGATAAAQGKDFHLRLSLKDGSGNTLHGSYPYATYDAQGNAVDGASGQVGDGGTISLKDGQHVVLTGLPANAAYEVQEVDVPNGFTLTSSEGTTGTITPEGSSEASFRNAYKTYGSVTLEATKVFKGASLADGQFAFELRDAAGHTMQTAHNDANGKVTFSPISYSASDDGKTFTYRIVEVNDGQPGVTYDTHTCLVEVRVADDGAGNLTTTTTYKTDSLFGLDGSNNTFTNTTASALPQTGGSGLGWPIGLGTLVFATALIVFWKKGGPSWLDSLKKGGDE